MSGTNELDLDNYPRWSLTIERSNGAHLRGTCGCLRWSLEAIKSETIGNAWDHHVWSDTGVHR